MLQPKTNSKIDLAAHSRFRDPYDNLLYGILLQAVSDNDINFLKHGDGAIIWAYLTTCAHTESAPKTAYKQHGKARHNYT